MTAILPPDRAQLAAFLDALFRYADDGTFVSWRAFRDDVKNAPPVLIESTAVGGDRERLVDDAERYAAAAAAFSQPAVFCPPVVTLNSATRAREADLANGLALSVECDAQPARARAVLERLLGPATVVVSSGGMWLDPESGTPHPKLHLHWRLSEPTADAESHARLKRARILATALVGGDATNTPAVHPIRWPGSWHRKGTPRMASIASLHAEAETHLSDAVERLEEAVRASGARVGDGAGAPPTNGSLPAGPTTGDLVRQILTGEAMHAPLAALAWRYLWQGMAPAQVVLTLRGIMDAVPESLRSAPDQPQRWQGHYDDIPRAVRTAAEKIGEAPPAPPPIRDDVRAFVAELSRPPRVALLETGAEEDTPLPADLLTPPGVLGDIARYGTESSVRPIPAFAVQAALALGSVVCARRYVTDRRNYSSLYFLNVAKSGTGKEEAKTTIEAILTAAGQRKLVGGSTYSSGNAVYSALLRKPQHVAVLDEFGKYMEQAAAGRDGYRGEVLTMFMEAFGRVHADMSTPQFSTMTMRAPHAAEIEPKIIARPAITLLALTTPGSFYGAMTSTRVLDGFLNRFLVAEHVGPREPARDADPNVEVPPSTIAWVQQMLAPRGDMDDLFRLDCLPEPTVVPLTASAHALSAAFEREMLARADQLDVHGLGDMAIRTREIGLRLGLICGLADAPDAPAVTIDVLEWAFRYVRFYLEQTVGVLRRRLADSEHERARNRVYELIRAAGARGVTDVEFNKKPFVGLARGKRERYELLESLLKAEEIAWVDVPQGPQGGRPRRALIAIGSSGSSDSSSFSPESFPHEDAPHDSAA